MTFKERLQKEHPEKVSKKWEGGCSGCPASYGYEDIDDPARDEVCPDCEECWNREIPETGIAIKIKYFRDVQKIEEISGGDWLDLRAAEEVTMKAGEFKMIPLGVAMELPNGYEAWVVPRSSTFKKHGVILVNSIGIIDEDYKGDNDEWNFLAYAMRDTVIPKNTRICQFRIIEHQPKLRRIEVETLGNPDRGGIGSTGEI